MAISVDGVAAPNSLSPVCRPDASRFHHAAFTMQHGGDNDVENVPDLLFDLVCLDAALLSRFQGLVGKIPNTERIA
ncbi:hypothetical protein NKJ13_31285 [Mesorhizobium sp. M0174]|uniref:hypothetical protein n=1 Tax=Mesorhizobium sp. M0174 TaxID=2956904 RepID=UPI00333B2FCE